jgi:hypothetical protein
MFEFTEDAYFLVNGLLKVGILLYSLEVDFLYCNLLFGGVLEAFEYLAE